MSISKGIVVCRSHIVNISNDGVYTMSDGCGVDFIFRYCNAEMATVEGVPVEEMLNRSFLSNGIMLPDYTEYSNGDGIRKSVDSFVAGYLSDYIDFYKKIYPDLD